MVKANQINQSFTKQDSNADSLMWKELVVYFCSKLFSHFGAFTISKYGNWIKAQYSTNYNSFYSTRNRK